MGRQVEGTRDGADVVESLFKEFQNDSDIAGFNIPLVISEARSAKESMKKLLEDIPKWKFPCNLAGRHSELAVVVSKFEEQVAQLEDYRSCLIEMKKAKRAKDADQKAKSRELKIKEQRKERYAKKNSSKICRLEIVPNRSQPALRTCWCRTARSFGSPPRTRLSSSPRTSMI